MGILDINKIRDYFSTQPVKKAWIFGSYARGEETPESDVDIIVSLDEGVGLFKYAAISKGLEQLIEREIDLVSEGTLYPWVASTADQEKILIYEREATR